MGQLFRPGLINRPRKIGGSHVTVQVDDLPLTTHLTHRVANGQKQF